MYILPCFLLSVLGRYIFKSWGAISGFIFVLRVVQDPQDGNATSFKTSMLRRRILNDAAPLWKPKISQLISMAGDKNNGGICLTQRRAEQLSASEKKRRS